MSPVAPYLLHAHTLAVTSPDSPGRTTPSHGPSSSRGPDSEEGAGQAGPKCPACRGRDGKPSLGSGSAEVDERRLDAQQVAEAAQGGVLSRAAVECGGRVEVHLADLG